MAIFEPGRCDAADCASGYINPGISCTGSPPCNTFGNCILEGNKTPFNVPAEVPIKTVLKGVSISPWVRVRFESDIAPWGVGKTPLKVPPSFWDYTEITTGNISQPGCVNSSNRRPKAGLEMSVIKAITGNNPNSPITLNTADDRIYENCDEKCRAAIKNFQYSWGTVDSGTKCKVTIIDELGSSLNQWIGRIFRNPTNTPMTPPAQAGGPNATDTVAQGVYKMKVTFGWLVLDSDEECPIDGSLFGPASCTPSAVLSGTGWTSYSSRPARLICSPPIWFLPDQLLINVSNGRYIYEIEGIDLMQRAQQQPSARVYGAGNNKMHFALAVKKMLAECNPPMDVSFMQLSPDGKIIEPLMFTVPTNVAAIPDIVSTTPLQSGGSNLTDLTCRPDNIMVQDIPAVGQAISATIPTTVGPVCKIGYRRAFERLGPRDTWACHELGPLATIHQWMNRTTAQGIPIPKVSHTPPRGLVMNYDPIYMSSILINVGTPQVPNLISKTVQGRVLIWASPHPSCAQTVFGIGQIKGVYIVNGGACSPVLSFTPTMKWNFQAAVASGGTAGPSSGRMASTSDARQALRCHLPGRGARIGAVVGTGQADDGGLTATSQAIINAGAHKNANLLHHAIEAELKVQGDPSDYLCSPIFGFGRSIALVVINPYYIDGDDTNGCAMSWKTLTSSSCNSILTSRNWFIKGVDHQIKEGSYVTTYKLILFAPNAEVNPTRSKTPVALGGEIESPTSSAPGRFACSQGTMPCMEDDEISPFGPRGTLAYIVGATGTKPGAGEWCDVECADAIGPI